MTGRPNPIFAELEVDPRTPDERRAIVAEHVARLEGGAVGERLERSLDRMIAIQCEAYPSDWSDADKREMAEIHLFGSK